MEIIREQDLQKLSHTKQILFACFCAEQVLHLVEEKHKEVCTKAIKTAYLFVEGKATEDECYSAAHAAAYAASNKEQTIAEQWTFYDQLLNGDKYFEEIVLETEQPIQNK